MQSWTCGTISSLPHSVFVRRKSAHPCSCWTNKSGMLVGASCWRTAAASSQQWARYLVKQTLWFASASPYRKLVNYIFMLSDLWFYFIWQSLHQKIMRVVSPPNSYCTSFSGTCRNIKSGGTLVIFPQLKTIQVTCWTNPSIVSQYILGDLLLLLSQLEDQR